MHSQTEKSLGEVVQFRFHVGFGSEVVKTTNPTTALTTRPPTYPKCLEHLPPEETHHDEKLQIWWHLQAFCSPDTYKDIISYPRTSHKFVQTEKIRPVQKLLARVLKWRRRAKRRADMHRDRSWDNTPSKREEGRETRFENRVVR